MPVERRAGARFEPVREKCAHGEDGVPGEKSWLRFIAGEAEECLWRRGCQERRVGCERRVFGLGPQRQESGSGEGVPVERRAGSRFRAGKAKECTWRRRGARREELAATDRGS